MFCTKNAYTVGGGASVSLQEKGHTHTLSADASLTASVHGFQSLFGSGLQADFFSDRTIGRVYFLPNVRTGTHF